MPDDTYLQFSAEHQVEEAVNFRSFLDLAETLARGTAEAEWRTSISRAYYASFHVSCAYLRLLGFAVPRSKRGHGYAWLRLSNCGNADIIQSGRDLNDLRGDRNEADYDEKTSIGAPEAKAAVNLAKKIVSNLDAALAEPSRSQIQGAIRQYEKDVLKEVTWKP